MIPFEQTWPYDKVGNDYFVHECPFCHAGHVLLNLKHSDVKAIQTGTKKLLVFPCCFEKIKVIDMDDDYLLAQEKLRSL